jgi:septal ring factor EnvC (AmiA/AmiB activator)
MRLASHPQRVLAVIAWTLAVAASMIAWPAAADELADNKARLRELRERIEDAKAALSKDRSREDALTTELRELEQRIGDLTSKLDNLDRRVAQKSDRVAALRRQYNDASERVDNQRHFLRRQVRAAYYQGREAYLRLLLNQQRPAAVDRMMVYFDYFNDARSQRIATAVAELEELAALRGELDDELARLEQLRKQRRDRLDALNTKRQERQSLLAELRERIGERDQRIERLRSDADKLSDLVGRLRSRLADIPDNPGRDVPFETLQGQLRWPLDGNVAGQYGTRRAEGVDWNGLLINAEAGQPVRAVARGRVVFADWLRGLGLLIIIDHGDGYMTLYGHNQSLYSEAGDWVAAGDIVATVGASGGREQPSLYFELRSQGQPVDPTAWLGPVSPAG